METIAVEQELWNGDTFVEISDSVGNHDFNAPVYYYEYNINDGGSQKYNATQNSENLFTLNNLPDIISFRYSLKLSISRFYMNNIQSITLYNEPNPILTTHIFPSSTYNFYSSLESYPAQYRNIVRTWLIKINNIDTYSGSVSYSSGGSTISLSGLSPITYTGTFELYIKTNYEYYSYNYYLGTWNWVALISYNLIDNGNSEANFPDKTFTATF